MASKPGHLQLGREKSPDLGIANQTGQRALAVDAHPALTGDRGSGEGATGKDENVFGPERVGLWRDLAQDVVHGQRRPAHVLAVPGVVVLVDAEGAVTEVRDRILPV